MARKTATYTVSTGNPENRDEGKVYILTEWDASRAENWGLRAIGALWRAGIEVPATEGGNMIAAAVAAGGIRSLTNLNSAEAVGLLNELMECVTMQPDPKRPEITRPLVENDIEEVATRLRLKDEVFRLHTGFSFADAASKLISMVKSAISQFIPTSQGSSP